MTTTEKTGSLAEIGQAKNLLQLAIGSEPGNPGSIFLFLDLCR